MIQSEVIITVHDDHVKNRLTFKSAYSVIVVFLVTFGLGSFIAPEENLTMNNLIISGIAIFLSIVCLRLGFEPLMKHQRALAFIVMMLKEKYEKGFVISDFVKIEYNEDLKNTKYKITVLVED